jgi:hypothetical protein
MKTPLGQDCRRIDFSAVVNGDKILQKQIARFVKGIRGKRSNPVSTKQIYAWFSSTPKGFVSDQLNEAIGRTIRPVRNSLRNGRNNAAVMCYYEYLDSEERVVERNEH